MRLHWDPNAHSGPLSIYLVGKIIRLPLMLCAVAQVFYTPCTWKCWLTNKFHGAGSISGSLVWTRCHRPAESSFAQAIFVWSSFLAHFSCPNKKLSYSQRSPHWRPRFSVLGGIALWDIQYNAASSCNWQDKRSCRNSGEREGGLPWMGGSLFEKVGCLGQEFH